MALDIGSIELLKDKIYSALKSEIIFGRYKPGDEIHIINVASEMNISTAPVREALNMLQKDGLVSLVPHKRPTVTAVDSKDWQISMELRLILEPYAARYSCDKIPQKEIDNVRAKLEAVLGDPTDEAAYVSSDMALHELLYKYSGSSLIIEILDSLKVYTTRIRYSIEIEAEDRPDDLEAIVTASTREHLDILDALDARDPALAEEKVRIHIQNYMSRNKDSEQKSLA